MFGELVFILYKFNLQIIEKEINPFVDEWEKSGQFPAHHVFKKLGKAGCLGVNKPAGNFMDRKFFGAEKCKEFKRTRVRSIKSVITGLKETSFTS